ncbi:MAG: hypothetical protein ISN64_00015 [Rickettsia sp.]|nr:hypothetical protein [Rickettsia sp.]
MSGQLLEIIIFATVAIILCNKLISLVGKTSERTDDEQSFFGEKDVIKDITYTEVLKDFNDFTQKNSLNPLEDLINLENKDLILKNYEALKRILPEFNMKKFLLNSKKALKIILENRESEDTLLLKLIDKRYLKDFKKFSRENYTKINSKNLENLDSMSSKISEICLFGNNVFIKVIYSKKDFISKEQIFNEEWTFSKNTSLENKIWFLNQIEKI